MTDIAAQEKPAPGGRAAKGVFIRTYGCQMNVYDSERMADLLRPLGYRAVAAPEAADLVILNTCHIREKATEKVFSDIGRLKPLKDARAAQGRPMLLAVAGCVAQAEGGEIAARAPAVDMVFGPQAYHRLPEMLARAARERGEILETDFSVEEKFDRLPERSAAGGPTAFLTIQEGCDKFCAFCVVPYTRGSEVSRPAAALIAEAESLARRGVRELTLLGQNVNAWSAPAPAGFGAGIKPRKDGLWGLGQLCRALSRLEGIERLRFTTSHPRDMDDDIIEALGALDKLMPYLHLPVQSGSDRILKAMNRGHTAADYAALIGRVRAARPDIALSGDFIVGFPGETDEDFKETLALIETLGYASAYSFKYSRRPGTPAAGLPKQVPEAVKDERLAALQAAIETQRRAFAEAQTGRVLPVLFEKKGRHSGQLIGRSPYLQSVHATAPESMLGSIIPVRICGATPNALAGELCEGPMTASARAV